MVFRGERPTALIAMNDLTAIGAIRAANERGIRVPERFIGDRYR